MIKIRLQRHGARHAPFYRMVVTPATTRRDGKFIEVLGTYNPQAHSRTEELKLKMERIDHWLGVGAQPTDTAKSLIRLRRQDGSSRVMADSTPSALTAFQTHRVESPAVASQYRCAMRDEGSRYLESLLRQKY